MRQIEDETARARAKKRFAKARDRDVLDEDFPELVTFEGGAHRIRDNPPLIYHLQGEEEAVVEARVREAFERYRATLAEDKRLLLDRYEFKDIAMKVVGVGSVGTRCAIMLMMGGADDPLFLQVKEARASVLEPYAGQSIYPNHGQRVVMGQRLMQSASDIFLGWTETDKGTLLYPANARHESQAAGRAVQSIRDESIRRTLRLGRWRAPMPVPAMRRKSQATWARKKISMKRWRIFLKAMPTRTSWIIKHWCRRCRRGAWKFILSVEHANLPLQTG